MPTGNLVIRSRLAHAAKRLKADPQNPELQERVSTLSAAYTASVLEDHILAVVTAAPPLTAEQRDKLALLLRGAA
jgi:hypothetical protein